MTRVALISRSVDLGFLQPLLHKADPALDLVLWPDPAFADAEVAICWDVPSGVYASMPRLRLVHSVAAGVDNVIAGQDIRNIPVCRVVDPNQAAGMLQYVLWSVLYFHRGFDEALTGQQNRQWVKPAQRTAASYRVGVMGLGEIGAYVAVELSRLGYDVHGWARSRRDIEGVEVFAGMEEYEAFLEDVNALVCLLPLTPQTTGILNRRTFDTLPAGATLVQCGRGPQLVEADLLRALDNGRLRGAILDVFATEPLAADSPFWTHPNVMVTPHMATTPTFSVAVEQIAINIQRLNAGLSPNNAVDPLRGY